MLFPPRRATPIRHRKQRSSPTKGEWGGLRWCSFHPGARAGQTPRRHGTPTGGTVHHGGAREKPSPRGVGRRLYNDTPLKPAVLRRHVRPLRRAHTAASWTKNVVNIRFYYPYVLSVTTPVTQANRCNKTQKLLPYICNHKPQSFRINVTQYTFLI